jgi:hypothetical protein
MFKEIDALPPLVWKVWLFEVCAEFFVFCFTSFPFSRNGLNRWSWHFFPVAIVDDYHLAECERARHWYSFWGVQMHPMIKGCLALQRTGGRLKWLIITCLRGHANQRCQNDQLFLRVSEKIPFPRPAQQVALFLPKLVPVNTFWT